jgi:hypothetical protein
MSQQPSASLFDASPAPSTAPDGATAYLADADHETAPSSSLEGWFRDAEGRLRRVDSDG